MKKLHLGCGKVRIPGYINIDIQAGNAVDMVTDIRNLPLEKKTYDLIYSCAVIEHFGRREWQPLLEYWAEFLKPGGLMRISTNDFDACVEQYTQNKNMEELLGILIGGQKDSWDKHGMIFTFDVLKLGLEKAGFDNIRRYDWRETDYGKLGVDDFSQAYLPHMNKNNGRLMVLNVEATKK